MAWIIVAIFCEGGEIREIHGEAGLPALISQALSKPCQFEIVLVHSLSRGFRNVGDQEQLLTNWFSNGVKIVSETENFSDENSGPLVRKMIGIANEMKFIDARIGTMRGMVGTARAVFNRSQGPIWIPRG